jgi:hypothetical protein
MRSHLLAPLSVRGYAAFNLASISDATTKTMIAVLTLIAALMVVVGLIRAWAGRLRPQVVIEDVVPNEGLPSSSASGLSPQLRQAVRQALQQQSEAARTSVYETLEQDIEGRLLRASGSVQVKAITTGLRSTTEDSLAVLAAGVRAVASKEAEGLLAALSAALPTQRGWAIRAFPVLRDTGSRATVGIAVELAQLGHPPDAVATFWSSSNEMQLAESDQAHDAARSSMYRLLDPTALWIATRLVSRQLAQSDAPIRWRLLARGKLGQELAGLQMQLAGQLALYAMRRQPKFEREFAQQALADLAESARLLPEYFMPHLIKGAVHVRVGWSYRRSGEMQNAANEFSMGVHSYDEAAQKLENASDANLEKREAALERVKVWRAKCRLLSGDPGQLAVARQELAELCHITGTASRDLYNGACLFAVAIGCPDIPSDEKLLFTRRAWFLLGRALLAGGAKGPWMLAMTDIELEAMKEPDRRSFCDMLKARSPWKTKLDDEGETSLVRESMLAIGIALPRGYR